MIIESSSHSAVCYQREGKVWGNEYVLLSEAPSCFTRGVLPTMSFWSLRVNTLWPGKGIPRQKFGAALVEKGHYVQAMKQAVPLTERVDREVMENIMNNLKLFQRRLRMAHY